MKNRTRIDFASVLDAPIGEDTGRQIPGALCAANESRFTAAYFSEPLTTFATGWRDPENVDAQLDLMCPPVAVPRRFEFKQADSTEAFLSESDDVRAIGAPFKRIEYKGTSVNQKTHNKGLTIRLDRDEMVDGDEERAVNLILSRLPRNDLRRFLALVLANDTNTGKTWDATAGKDPDSDVLAEVITSGDARGIDANTVVFGQTAWQKRFLSLSAQTAPALAARAALTLDQLANLLAVDRCMLSRARYQSSSSAKSKIVAAYVAIYYASPIASKDDPSNFKRFWTPTESGRFRVYRQEEAKWIDISVEHYSNLVCTSTLGVRTLTIS